MSPTRTLVDAVDEYHETPTGRDRDAGGRLLRQFIAVCGAIAYAHDQGVLHRDLKPQNVMVGEFREVQVMDWGLSKVLFGSETEVQTVEEAEQTGGNPERAVSTIKGTPAYMAPEQAHGQPIGPPADVFALGGILYHILTNRSVYDGASAAQVFWAARDCDTRPALGRLPADTPAELVDLITRCLAKNPADRPASAKAVGQAVSDYLASAEQRAREAELSRVRAEEQAEGDRKRLLVDRWRRRWQLAAVAVGLALVFGGVAAGIWYRFDRDRLRLEDEARTMEEERKDADRKREEERQATTRATDVTAAVEEMYAALDEDKFAPAEAALQRAKGRLGLDPPADLNARVCEADTHYTAAVNLDQARQEAVVQRMAPKLSSDGTPSEYAQKPVAARFAEQFAKLGCSPEQPDVADRIQKSRIRRSLVAALDAWGGIVRGKSEEDAILACARAADPDPVWRDRFRDPAVRADYEKLQALIEEIGLEKLTVSQLVLVINRIGQDLPQPTVTRLLRVIEARRPNEFWLHLFCVGWFAQIHTPDLEQRRAAWLTATSHARTALALRPDSDLARVALGLLLARVGDPGEAEQIAEQLSRSGYDGVVKYQFLTIAALKRHDYRAALAHIDRIIQLIPGDTQARILRIRAPPVPHGHQDGRGRGRATPQGSPKPVRCVGVQGALGDNSREVRRGRGVLPPCGATLTIERRRSSHSRHGLTPTRPVARSRIAGPGPGPGRRSPSECGAGRGHRRRRAG